jgi:hypothetical protein
VDEGGDEDGEEGGTKAEAAEAAAGAAWAGGGGFGGFRHDGTRTDRVSGRRRRRRRESSTAREVATTTFIYLFSCLHRCFLKLRGSVVFIGRAGASKAEVRRNLILRISLE